jgi:selenophosphate synthase
MNTGNTTFESVVSRLRLVPTESLPQIEAYLETFLLDNGAEENNRAAILSLAGGWSEMSEEDFQDYLSEARRSGGDAFDREVRL